MRVAIVVAGGVGKRLKSRVHKPFIRLRGRPMLAWTLGAFEKTPGIDGVILVAHRSDLPTARRLIRSCRFRKILQVVPGGASRMESVSCGLKAVPPEAEWVAVHDAARPLVTPALIEATLRAALRAKAAIAAVPVVPTVKQARGPWVEKTLDRSRLWEVQTPQAFHRVLLERAHAQARTNGAVATVRGNLTRRLCAPTDDAALVEQLGHRVRIVMGSPRNIKVTTPEDLVIAEAFLKR